MEQQPNTIPVKEEKPASDDEDDTVQETLPFEEIIKEEPAATEDEEVEMILTDGLIKEESDEGEERHVEIASVMLPEFDEAYENEGAHIQEDVLRVKTVSSLRPGPKSKKRKLSNSSQDLEWNPNDNASKVNIYDQLFS